MSRQDIRLARFSDYEEIIICPAIILELTICHEFPHLSNTDKMTDEEKIPIAIAGLAAVSLPFIAGLIALYAAQG